METISASQVTQLTGQFACPASYYFGKIAKYPMKPSANMEIGKAIEEAVTNYHMTKTMKPEIFQQTIDRIKEGTYADRFGVPAKGYKDLPDDEKIEFDTKIAEVDHVALLEEYKNCVRPLTIIKAQMEIVYDIFEGSRGPVRLYNYPDLLTQEEGLVEVKTASKSWSENDEKKKFQHVVESMAVEHKLGFRPKIAYHVLVKTKKPKVQIIPLEVTNEDIEQVTMMLKNAYEMKCRFNYVPYERDKTHCYYCGKDHSKEYFFGS